MEKKPNTKDYTYDRIYMKFQRKANQSNRKQINDWHGQSVGEGTDCKDTPENMLGDGDVLFQDCGSGCITAHICENTLNHTLKISKFSFIYIVTHKSAFKKNSVFPSFNIHKLPQ